MADQRQEGNKIQPSTSNTGVNEENAGSKPPNFAWKVFGKSDTGGFGGLAAKVTSATHGSGLAFGSKDVEHLRTVEDKTDGVAACTEGSPDPRKECLNDTGNNLHSKPQDSKEEQSMADEMDEESVFSCHAMLFEFEGSWKERGRGLLKVNCSKTRQKARILMHQKGNLKLLLNANIWKDMQISKLDGGMVGFAGKK